MIFTFVFLLLLSVSGSLAAPTGAKPASPPASAPASKAAGPPTSKPAAGPVKAMSSAEIDVFKPYSWYASAAYCKPDDIETWKCGIQCSATSDFKLVKHGGDGSKVQYWFVGYSPSLKSLVVAHQGTDPSKLKALETDAKILLTSLDEKLFPKMNKDIRVHKGFRDEHALTAAAILAAVKEGKEKHAAKDVVIVGHSLGAALALLQSVYLPLHLPELNYKIIGYGMPRVGNKVFADYIDGRSKIPVHRITNHNDFVPIIPGRHLGYHHPSGEIHIDKSGKWQSCSGQDNDSGSCSTGDVKTVLSGSVTDHGGPYGGVPMGGCRQK